MKLYVSDKTVNKILNLVCKLFNKKLSDITNQFMPAVKYITAANIDALVEPGFYSINGTTDCDPPAEYGALIVLKSSRITDNYIEQIFFEEDSLSVYIRSCDYDGNWGIWTGLLTRSGLLYIGNGIDEFDVTIPAGKSSGSATHGCAAGMWALNVHGDATKASNMLTLYTESFIVNVPPSAFSNTINIGTTRISHTVNNNNRNGSLWINFYPAYNSITFHKGEGEFWSTEDLVIHCRMSRLKTYIS